MVASTRTRPVHYLQAFGWIALAGFLKVLPRGAMIALADAAGRVMFSALRIRRQVVLDNLVTAFPALSDEERLRIGLLSYQNLALSFFESIQPDSLWPSARHIFVGEHVNEEHYRGLLGKAAIVLTAHIGNWEAMPNAVDEGITLAAIAKPLHNPIVDRMVTRQRERQGMRILPTASSMKGAIDAIRRGEWLVFLGDQDAGSRGLFVPFFGRPASTARGPALFAWKTNTPILPVFAIRDGSRQCRLRLQFAEPILPDPSAHRDAEIERITRAHVRALEEVIRKYPSDYFWVHKRWKSKPQRIYRAAE
jgi:Kdo2-lipid IVA lauroyltransferase/acyltransferase